MNKNYCICWGAKEQTGEYDQTLGISVQTPAIISDLATSFYLRIYGNNINVGKIEKGEKSLCRNNLLKPWSNRINFQETACNVMFTL